MDGPGHYQEAERLLALAASEGAGSDGLQAKREQAALILAEAQVHATLANAAAVALGLGRLEEVRWRDIAGSTRGGGT